MLGRPEPKVRPVEDTNVCIMRPRRIGAAVATRRWRQEDDVARAVGAKSGGRT